MSPGIVDSFGACVLLQTIARNDQVYGAMLNEKPSFGWHAAMIVSLVGFKDFEKYDRESLALKGVELKDSDDLLQWLRGYKPNKNGLWLPESCKSLEPKPL
ncbi:MAG TPA: hypothetical protein VN937_14565 [Blastocatellia bacterium]|nr:hypothetical protein [Blastocatellia bacterium]